MNKKETKKRLLIFLIFSFALVWIPTILYIAFGGKYADEDGILLPAMNYILMCTMLCPTIAMVLTRKITKEGFAITGKGSMLLGMDFKNKKWIWFLVALLLPVAYRESGYALWFAFSPQCFDTSLFAKSNLPIYAAAFVPILCIVSSIIGSFGGLGEEAGWRGYMMPKLEELFGIRRAVIIGGVIWGVWHYPALYLGHNFGTDYWGAPWLGFLCFTIITIALNAMLTLVTKKTDSIWPAAFLHAVNNAGASSLGVLCNFALAKGIFAQTTVFSTITFIPALILGIIAMALLERDARHTTIES